MKSEQQTERRENRKNRDMRQHWKQCKGKITDAKISKRAKKTIQNTKNWHEFETRQTMSREYTRKAPSAKHRNKRRSKLWYCQAFLMTCNATRKPYNLRPAVNRQPVFPPERLVEKRYSEEDEIRNYNTNNLKMSKKRNNAKHSIRHGINS